jgi:hypothetical protein
MALVEELKQKNPFGRISYSFDTASQAVSRISEGFGKWQHGECKELKDTLVSMDVEGTGRVSLTDFYARRQTPTGAWVFQETQDYLRNLGVLDESSTTKGAQLLVPNYVLSMSNCVEPSDYYSICCLSECEGLLGAIEAEVRAPLVTPAEIFPVVERLLATAATPRNLTEQLRTQLDTVAEKHRGKVPLHGRLFSQWLHYVFPQECPFPVLSEGHNPLTASEWMDQGKDTVLSEEEIEELPHVPVEEDLDDSDADLQPTAVHHDFSQWTMAEELYVGHHHEGPRRGSQTGRGLGGTGNGLGRRRGAFAPGSPQPGVLHSFLGALAKLGCVAAAILALKPLVMQNINTQAGAVDKMKGLASPKDVFV